VIDAHVSEMSTRFTIIDDLAVHPHSSTALTCTTTLTNGADDDRTHQPRQQPTTHHPGGGRNFKIFAPEGRRSSTLLSPMFKTGRISSVPDLRLSDHGGSTWPSAAVLWPVPGTCGCRVPAPLQRREADGMTSDVAVTVVFPDGSSQTWKAGTQVIVADGVEPLSATMLGNIVGMLAAAGLLIPRDDLAMSFDSILPRDELTAAVASTLKVIEAEQSRFGDNEE